VVDALRNAGALSVSLVAELDGKIVGHIAFSPVTIADGSEGWYGLGPISVTPDEQRRGIGSMLIRASLERLKKMGGKGCALVGDPAYYVRFGFRNPPELIHEGVPQDVFLALGFDQRPKAKMPRGSVAFHEAFLVKAWPSRSDGVAESDRCRPFCGQDFGPPLPPFFFGDGRIETEEEN
jgi:putative acetyltransferase